MVPTPAVRSRAALDSSNALEYTARVTAERRCMPSWKTAKKYWCNMAVCSSDNTSSAPTYTKPRYVAGRSPPPACCDATMSDKNPTIAFSSIGAAYCSTSYVSFSARPA